MGENCQKSTKIIIFESKIRQLRVSYKYLKEYKKTIIIDVNYQ